MNKLRIVFLGTPDIACGFLSRIAASGHEVAGVVSQPDRPSGRGLKLCCSPVSELSGERCFETFKPADKNELHEVIARLKPDLAVAVAYGLLIPERTLALARLGFLNVHFSLLPRYRGAAPVQWALINGDTETGVTLFWLDKGMDTGPVFLRRAVPIPDGEGAPELFARLARAGEELLAEGLVKAAAGELAREPQSGEPSSAPKITADTARLDFSLPAPALLGKVRGLACGPRARFTIPAQDRKVTVQVLSAAAATEQQAGGAAGAILSVEPGGGFIVKCGVGALLVKTVKPEGKREMNGADFLNGMRLRAGDSLLRG